MAFGKGRGNKRSSSTSYASTITMVVFVALCVIGVWMLSSNSIIPPQISQANTRTVISETERADVSASSNGNDEPEPTRQESDEHPTFEDNPGKLPDDAIKSEYEQQKSAKEKNEKTSSKARDEVQRETQSQETQQDNEKIPEEKEKDNKMMQESDEGRVKQVVKEFEKEQKEQRDEDSGAQSGNNKGTQEQEQEQGQGKEFPDVEQGKKDQDSNAEVTYTDKTKEEQPMETEQGGTSEN
ncbi:BnaA01g19670D [Brassica napus]|uniref:BnaA01g19670D protein n=3 Tax=Brassica TaxID=3705 RepID=A0A078H3S1_BRANA|nr:BnaA01g19670D [Brassica napus]